VFEEEVDNSELLVNGRSSSTRSLSTSTKKYSNSHSTRELVGNAQAKDVIMVLILQNLHIIHSSDNLKLNSLVTGRLMTLLIKLRSLRELLD
jgi:hypothetical protein